MASTQAAAGQQWVTTMGSSDQHTSTRMRVAKVMRTGSRWPAHKHPHENGEGDEDGLQWPSMCTCVIVAQLMRMGNGGQHIRTCKQVAQVM